MKFIVREIPPRALWNLEKAGIHPLLARLYAARGVQSPADIDPGLAHLLAPAGLLQIDAAARLLADAIDAGQRIVVVADYDCDGATACALAVRGLRLLGATDVRYLVPDRIVDGYGLTPPLARRVHDLGGQVLVTVDNGIASHEGVDSARALGLRVLVTDHHLPAPERALPAADAIVNPNQPGCPFASKALAGVGVMFYVLLALRAHLREQGRFAAGAEPRLDALLPLVALGTVADVVGLDSNNRRLVAQGLQRIRAGAMPAGLGALLEVAGRDVAAVSAADLGFAVGPRINAAGRLSDMTLGIECLITDDPARARELAQTLDAINRERRDIEVRMREQAFDLAQQWIEQHPGGGTPAALTVFGEGFHEGVVGIVAARLKDRLHRPCFVFAPAQAPGELKGSGRSIDGFHLRDALDLVAKRSPDVLLRFGGHAMAAGCTLRAERLHEFDAQLQAVARERLAPEVLQRVLSTDGPLDPAFRRTDVVEALEREVWGQGFAAPLFCDEVEVVSQRLVGQAQNHLSLKLHHGGETLDAVWFGRTEPLPPRARLAYRLGINSWQGRKRVQLLVEALHGE